MFEIRKLKIAVTVISCGVFVFLAAGSVSDTSTNNMQEDYTATSTTTTESVTVPEEPKVEEVIEEVQVDDLELLSYDSVAEEYARYVVGKIRNNTEKTYSYAHVEIKTYDANGNVIGTTLDNVTNLDPGETWSFKAIILEDETETYKITDIDGW